MLGLSGNAFARLENFFPKRAHMGPFLTPVLCSEGPSMAVTCSAHAVSHVNQGSSRTTTAIGTAGGAGERL